MKNKLTVISMLAVLFTFSCSLEEEFKSDLAVENYFNNEGEILSTTAGLYEVFWDWGYYIRVIPGFDDNASDIAFFNEGGSGQGNGDSFDRISRFEMDPDMGQVSQVWARCYVGVQRANVILDAVPGTNVRQEVKDVARGEALMMRSFFYYDLVTHYGPVPLKLTPTQDPNDYPRTRAPLSEIYQQLETDLIEAETLLPANFPNGEIGRSHKGTAQALLAKVYLNQEKWQEAAAAAKRCIDGPYELFPDFEALWQQENASASEFLLSMQTVNSYKWHVNALAYSNPPNSFYVSDEVGYNAGWLGGFCVFTKDFYESFDPADSRRNMLIDEVYEDSDLTLQIPVDEIPFFSISKYYDSDWEPSSNYPMLRLADVYLVRAEALNEANNGPDQEAYNAVNAVRNRAGLPGLAPGLSYQQFKDAVWMERGWELYGESKRRWDLVRTGRGEELVAAARGISVTAEKMMLPVPQDVLNFDPGFGQNPGY